MSRWPEEFSASLSSKYPSLLGGHPEPSACTYPSSSASSHNTTHESNEQRFELSLRQRTSNSSRPVASYTSNRPFDSLMNGREDRSDVTSGTGSGYWNDSFAVGEIEAGHESTATRRQQYQAQGRRGAFSVHPEPGFDYPKYSRYPLNGPDYLKPRVEGITLEYSKKAEDERRQQRQRARWDTARQRAGGFSRSPGSRSPDHPTAPSCHHSKRHGPER